MKSVFIALICTISLTALGQKFSGELTYTISAIPKSETAKIPQQILDQVGTYTYLIKNGYYQSTRVENNEILSVDTYRDDSKMIYSQNKEVSYISYSTTNQKDESPTVFTLQKDSTVKLLGTTCHLLQKSKDDVIQGTYYVSTKHKLDPESFSTHFMYDWYNQLKASEGALPLYSKSDNGDYWVVMETKSIKKRKLEESEFSIPTDKQLVPKISALDEPYTMEAPSEDLINCMKSVSDNLPKELRKKGFTSTVRFILHKDGSISNITLREKGNPLLDEAALKMIEQCGMPLIPGKIDGEVVDCEVVLPLRF